MRVHTTNAGLEKLYGELRAQGLEIFAFPSNQFMNQEPLSDEEIADFCHLNYSVSFPVPGILGSQNIKWNFTKFLVGRDGIPVKRYAPSKEPEEIKSDIEKYLSTDDNKK